MRAHRRAVEHDRVAARQGRASPAGRRPGGQGGGRTSLSARPRVGSPPRGLVLGTALRQQPRPAAARSEPFRHATAVLQPVYDRFTEGFDTADLKAAKALLNTLR